MFPMLFLCSIVHSFHIMSLRDWSTLPISDFLMILYVGLSVICMFNGNFSAQCAVRPPSRRVAAIPDDAITSAASFRNRMVAKISKMRKVLPVPFGASRNYNQPILLVIVYIILSYVMHCSETKFGRFV